MSSNSSFSVFVCWTLFRIFLIRGLERRERLLHYLCKNERIGDPCRELFGALLENRIERDRGDDRKRRGQDRPERRGARERARELAIQPDAELAGQEASGSARLAHRATGAPERPGHTIGRCRRLVVLAL